MKTITQYVMVENGIGRTVSSTGGTAEDTRVIVGEKFKLEVHFLDQNGQPLDIESGISPSVFSRNFVLAGDFDNTTAPCFETDAITKDSSPGVYTIIIDGTYTEQSIDFLGAENERPAGAEIMVRASGEDWVDCQAVVQWPIVLRNRRYSDTDTPIPVTPTGGTIQQMLIQSLVGIPLRRDYGQYNVTVSTAQTISLDLSLLALGITEYYTFEIVIMLSSGGSVTVPSGWNCFGNELDVTVGHIAYLACRVYQNGFVEYNQYFKA